MADLLGTVSRTEDGRYALVFERRLAHPVEKVWRAVTEQEHLRAWFPAMVDVDVPVGTKLRFEPTPEQQRRLGLTIEDVTYGEMLRREPPHLLEFSWGSDVLRWEISRVSDSECRLIFTHICDDRDSAAAHAPGWHAGLEVVEAQLDGREIDWSAWDRSEELADEYARRLS